MSRAVGKEGELQDGYTVFISLLDNPDERLSRLCPKETVNIQSQQAIEWMLNFPLSFIFICLI